MKTRSIHLSAVVVFAVAWLAAAPPAFAQHSADHVIGADPDCERASDAKLLTALRDAAAYAKAPEPTRLFVSGTPEEIGRQVGEQTGEALRALAPTFLRVAMFHTRKEKATLYAEAAELDKHLSDDTRAELGGVAAGSGLPYEDVLFMNTFYNLTVDRIACRQLAVWGDATVDGKLVHARNLDWRDYPGEPLANNHVILNVKPTDGVEYVMLTWPGLQSVLTGTNREGITVAFNKLTPNGPLPPAEPVFFTLKRILAKATTLDEAVAMLREAKPLGSGSIVISDSKIPSAVVLELYNGEIGVRTPDKIGMISNANHGTIESGLKSLRYTASAAEPVSRVATEMGVDISPDVARQVMAHEDVLLSSLNLLSVIFIPEENKMFLATGANPAAAGPFRQYELFPE